MEERQIARFALTALTMALHSADIRPMSDSPWRFRPLDEAVVQRLTQALGVAPVVARLLAARGCADTQEARRFLHPDAAQLHDPSLLPHMDRAARRIAAAVRDSEPIFVYGDYDVDGVCSAALLARGLRSLNANVTAAVPHRNADGYDLHPGIIETAHADGIRLVITTDCGSQAHEAIHRASELGLDVVVTDHHEPGPELPPAWAIVNPRLAGSAYPFPAISGAAVAFKTLQAVTRELGENEQGLPRAFLDLVALGAVADIMPLVDENRAMVHMGLAALAHTKKPGLRALLGGCVPPDVTPTTEHIAFQVAPRINAIGRMDDANIALQLLLTNDPMEAQRLAGRMEAANQERRIAQNRIFAEIQEQIAGRDLSADAILVFAADTWPTGLIGPVASRLVDAYHKPTILIAHNGVIGRGSARSYGDFQLMEALEGCRDLLGRCGGHPKAAGFDIPMENLPAFRERIQRLAAEALPPDGVDDRLTVDLPLAPRDLSLNLCRELSALEPFGHGHPAPLFASRFTLLAARTLGAGGAHLKLTVRGDGLPPTDVVWWKNGAAHADFTPGSEWLLCYRVSINRFNGRETLQLEAVDSLPADAMALPGEAASMVAAPSLAVA